MKRTNTFAVRPLSERDERLLRDLLDASASLWNEFTYERRQNFFDAESVWDTADYRKRYVGLLGSATAQQVIRKNNEAWRSFFAAREDGEDTAPPGYWGNEDEGRAGVADVHPQRPVHSQNWRAEPARNPSWPRLERRVRPWLP